VHGYGEGMATFDENSPNEIVKTLSRSLKTLEVKCHQALGEPSTKIPRKPLHELIKTKLMTHQVKIHTNSVDGQTSQKEQENLKAQNRELKKQVAEMSKLRQENERLVERMKRMKVTVLC